MTDPEKRTWRGYFPCPPDELQQMLRSIVLGGAEGAKVDFKIQLDLESSADKSKFAQIIAAVANSDDLDAHDDWGFIVVGAERGRLVGGATSFTPGVEEKLSTRLEDLLRVHLSPPPHISVVCYDDAQVGPWGAIVIRPSAEQPHLIKKESPESVPHEVWVRVGSSTQRAQAHDYARFIEKRVRRATRDAERELAMAQVRLREAEARVHAPAPAPPAAATTVERLGVMLPSTSRDVADLLIAEANALFERMSENSDALPWSFRSPNHEACEAALITLESAARPFVEAIACVIDRDSEARHDDAIVDAFRIVAREPSAPGSYNDILAEVRSYPISLSVYTVATLAAIGGRARLLRRVFEIELETRYGERTQPTLAEVPRRIMAARDLFRLGMRQDRLELPVSVRSLEVLGRWLGPFVRGRAVGDALAVGEFIVALGFMMHGHDPWPLPASYLYRPDADRAIRRFIRSRPPLLGELFNETAEKVLGRFDETAPEVVNLLVGGRGFRGGAVAAWTGRAGDNRSA